MHDYESSGLKLHNKTINLPMFSGISKSMRMREQALRRALTGSSGRSGAHPNAGSDLQTRGWCNSRPVSPRKHRFHVYLGGTQSTFAIECM